MVIKTFVIHLLQLNRLKRLLFTLLAALSLPTAVNAQVANYYLLVEWKKNNWTVPMQSKQLCEAAGQEVLDQKNNWEPKGNGKDGFPYYICVKAK